MKKINIIVLIISILFVGCSSTNTLTIKVTEPAPITVPANVKKVAVVNRTESSQAGNANVIDEILSLELLEIDSISSVETIEGLYDELLKINKFTDVENLDELLLKNSAIASFSPVLSPSKVKKLCADNGVDALFVLEYLDSDTKIDYSIVPTTINVAGVKIKAVETQATVRTNLLYGWRIYSSTGNVIFDEFAGRHNVVSSGRGINPMKAIRAVVGQKDAVESACYQKGQNYALKLLPYDIRVSRIYYVRGSENFKIGMRRARSGNWDGAAELWEKELNNPKAKIAGRAHYNMAIINEINGNVEKAITWAQKSYTDFNNKKALHYIKVLKRRRAKIEKLRIQEGGN